MSSLKEEYQKAYEDYLEARDHLWKIRDKIIKKEALVFKIREVRSCLDSLKIKIKQNDGFQNEK